MTIIFIELINFYKKILFDQKIILFDKKKENMKSSIP